MRWKSNKPKCEGQNRYITRFLLFPKRVNYEWRWLETATIRQKVDRVYNTYRNYLVWVDIEWVDENKKKGL